MRTEVVIIAFGTLTKEKAERKRKKLSFFNILSYDVWVCVVFLCVSVWHTFQFEASLLSAIWSFQVRLMHEAGYEIGNLDATLILQRPKLSPHKEVMRANLAKLLGADPSVVNLKAKTHEKVDSLGENRSIAAHTVVLLMRK